MTTLPRRCAIVGDKREAGRERAANKEVTMERTDWLGRKAA
jgi:hypothetical protein